MHKDHKKRLFDLILLAILLPMAIPLMVIISLLIIMTIGRPIFFIQSRPGLNCKPFRIIKFRTMKNTVDSKGKLLPDKYRMCFIGKILRKLSLDELPELINVVRGEMSLVGPRPLLMEYLQLYSNTQNQRHEVKPGITGLAQVNGRNLVNWEKRLELDVWYVKNRNMLLDIKILYQTFFTVISAKGISGKNSATMTKFKG